MGTCNDDDANTFGESQINADWYFTKFVSIDIPLFQTTVYHTAEIHNSAQIWYSPGVNSEDVKLTNENLFSNRNRKLRLLNIPLKTFFSLLGRE